VAFSALGDIPALDAGILEDVQVPKERIDDTRENPSVEGSLMIGSIVMNINSTSISVGVPLGLSAASDVEAPSPMVLEVGPSMASPTMVRFEDFAKF